jgi:hypothetical protein
MIEKQQFTANIEPWSTLRRGTPLTSPLTSILGTEVDPEQFTDKQLDKLRTHAAVHVPNLAPRELEQFSAELFCSPELLTAYFRPAAVSELRGGRTHVRMVLPFEYATGAAKRAAGAVHLRPYERQLAWIAAYAYPCGIFVTADPSQRPARELARIGATDSVTALRNVLLRDAMRALRSRNHELASTLAAVLDIGGQEDECDAQQVARLVMAVRMSMTRIQQIWRGW